MFEHTAAVRAYSPHFTIQTFFRRQSARQLLKVRIQGKNGNIPRTIGIIARIEVPAERSCDCIGARENELATVPYRRGTPYALELGYNLIEVNTAAERK